MLSIAPAAARAITTLVTTHGVPDTARIRLTPIPDADTEHQLKIQLSATPNPGHQIVEEQSAHVFLDARIANDLDDQTLEATTSENQVRFARPTLIRTEA